MARRKKDDTSEHSKPLGITLKPSQIEWLKKQGGVSATISKLINEKVNENDR